MKKHNIAFAFSTKDRLDYTSQTLPRICAEAEGNFDLYWLDGSATPEGKQYSNDFIYKWRNEHDGKNPVTRVFENVTGGSAAAIITGWQILYNFGYDYIGLIENDVLLAPGWFAKTMALFETNTRKASVPQLLDIKVGAVSARCFSDRVLEMQDGFAVMGNVGAGMIIVKRAVLPFLLEYWSTPFLWQVRDLCKHYTGRDYPIPEFLKKQDPELKKGWILSHDWNFEVILWSQGYQTLACVPSMAINLDDPNGERDPVQK